MKRTRRRITPASATQAPSLHCTATERVQWIERYRRSGQCQRTFAETHGLKLSQLRYWIYSPSPKADDVATAPRMQEVHLNSWPGSHAWSAEIVLPAGPTIRVDAALARELIVPLLQSRT